MNAAIFTKSAKGLILASGLIAVSSVMGYAQDGTVSLGTSATMPLTNAYVNPPTGMASLAGHSFDMSSGNAIILATGQSAAFAVSYRQPKAVYMLVNSYDTWYWYNGATVGSVTLKFSDGTTQSASLTIGGNLREWRTGAGSIVVTTTTDSSSSNAWTGTAQSTTGGGTAVIDMLTVNVASTGKTLTGITLSNSNTLNANGWGPFGLIVSGLTVDYTPIVLPGNSANTPAAQNSQAMTHSNSAIFTGTSPSKGQSPASANAGLTTSATSGTAPTDKSRSHR